MGGRVQAAGICSRKALMHDLGFRVLGFRVLGFEGLGFKVLGFGV